MADPAKEWTAKVNRVANDPRRFEARKSIAPAFTVPRQRADDCLIYIKPAGDPQVTLGASTSKVRVHPDGTVEVIRGPEISDQPFRATFEASSVCTGTMNGSGEPYRIDVAQAILAAAERQSIAVEYTAG